FMPLPDSRTAGVMITSSPPAPEGFRDLFRLYWADLSDGIYMLRTRYCAAGAPAYNTLSENTTETISKLRHKMREPSTSDALGRTGALFNCVRALRHQRQSGCCCPRRTLNVFDQTAKTIAFGIANANGRIKNLFSDLNQTSEECTAARQDHAARQLSIPTGILNFIGNVHQHLFSSWLQNVAKNLSRQLAWRAAADRWHFHNFAALCIG